MVQSFVEIGRFEDLPAPVPYVAVLLGSIKPWDPNTESAEDRGLEQQDADWVKKQILELENKAQSQENEEAKTEEDPLPIVVQPRLDQLPLFQYSTTALPWDVKKLMYSKSPWDQAAFLVH